MSRSAGKEGAIYLPEWAYLAQSEEGEGGNRQGVLTAAKQNKAWAPSRLEATAALRDLHLAEAERFPGQRPASDREAWVYLRLADENGIP